ncbi:serine/arginine repetitive matrix protein 1-like [Falco rusticolus]|uniref:serine/arginine repetitive matrix protein 1-like n=1 Tax=Falco rusticolus TaxID=120794 RepID=UPI001886619A|nr:serine/arginine repetitive matrix protein 1-like [Falco rusticolus]
MAPAPGPGAACERRESVVSGQPRERRSRRSPCVSGAPGSELPSIQRRDPRREITSRRSGGGTSPPPAAQPAPGSPPPGTRREAPARQGAGAVQHPPPERGGGAALGQTDRLPLPEEDGAPGETTPLAPPLSPARAVCSPLIARRGHPAPAAPPSRGGYIQRLLSRNFPGTASCDRTRSGASAAIAASRSRRTEPPPLSRRGSGGLTPPCAPPLPPAEPRETRGEQVVASDVTDRSWHGRRECELPSGTRNSGDLLRVSEGGHVQGTCSRASARLIKRIGSLGCSKGARICQESQRGHL